MPPTRAVAQSGTGIGNSLVYPKGILTRSRRVTDTNIVAKRKALYSPPKEKAVKRSALGDLTNAAGKSVIETKKVLKSLTSTSLKSNVTKTQVAKIEKKPLKVVKAIPTASLLTSRVGLPSALKEQKTVLKPRSTIAVSAASTASKAASRVEASVPQTAVARKEVEPENAVPQKRRSTRLRRSLMSNSEESSLYVSALDDSSDDCVITEEITKKLQKTEIVVDVSFDKEEPAPKKTRPDLPPGVEDFDGLHLDDPHQVSNYAQDIFEYLKTREADFVIRDYMEDQIHLNKWMRSLLVDWMVEVQENFELNHETLYLAVKCVDMYLSKVMVRKENLQLVGAASMFIASKYDERIPPLVEDLIFVCDGAYTHNQLLKMEVSILKTLNFEFGFPLSYRFLRRYARCAHIAMPQLTLARYILELSLMEYNFVCSSDSKLGAAALLLALRMQNISSWTPTLEYYSGYKFNDFKDIVLQLNEMLHKKPKSALMTVRNKYSHKVFFEVAKIPLIGNEEIFKTTTAV